MPVRNDLPYLVVVAGCIVARRKRGATALRLAALVPGARVIRADVWRSARPRRERLDDASATA